MIVHRGFRVEPWALHETALNLDVLAQTESLFALSNGFIGVRGNLDEGEPHGIPGTYLNGVLRAAPAAVGREPSSARRSRARRSINVTNGKLIRLLVDDEPFDVRYGELRRARSACSTSAPARCTRTAEWCSPAGRTVRVTSTRLVSFTHRAILAIVYEIEPLDARVNVVVQSELVANEEIPHVAGDPRSAAAHRCAARLRGARRARARPRSSSTGRGGAVCASPPRWSTSSSGTPGAAPRTAKRCPTRRASSPSTRSSRDSGCASSSSSPTAGRSERTLPALRDQVAAASWRRATAGWERLVAEQRAYLDDFWATRRRRARRRPRAAAGGALRAVSSALGRRARRATGDSRQGADRHRLRRPLLLGHRPLRHAGARVHRAERPPRTRCAGAIRRCRRRRSARATSASRARPIPGARFTARSARAIGRPAPRPFTSTRDIALAVILYVRATGDDALRARRRPRDPRRDGAPVALARALRPRRAALPHRRRHRPRRVQRHRRQQHLHEPHGQPEPRRRRRRVRAPSRQGARARRHARGDGGVARRRRARRHSLRREARRPPAVRGLHRARAVGLRGDDAGSVSADAALPLFRSLSKAGGQAAGPRAGHAALRRSPSRPSSGRATSITTSESPSAIRRCRRVSKRSPRPTPATCGSRSTTRPRRRSSTCTICSTTPPTGCTWRRSPGPGSRSSWASAACATSASR